MMLDCTVLWKQYSVRRNHTSSLGIWYFPELAMLGSGSKLQVPAATGSVEKMIATPLHRSSVLLRRAIQRSGGLDESPSQQVFRKRPHCKSKSICPTPPILCWAPWPHTMHSTPHYAVPKHYRPGHSSSCSRPGAVPNQSTLLHRQWCFHDVSFLSSYRVQYSNAIFYYAL